MNENINLVKILKNCPKNNKFYSVIHGDIEFVRLLDLNKILFAYKDGGCYYDLSIQSDGKLYNNGECIVFPSKEQRDWSKFTAPWYIKEKFDPKTLQPFDKVLVRDIKTTNWKCKFFSHISESKNHCFVCTDSIWKHCIPYNEDTKRLVGTTDDAPEYYCYWE